MLLSQKSQTFALKNLSYCFISFYSLSLWIFVLFTVEKIRVLSSSELASVSRVAHNESRSYFVVNNISKKRINSKNGPRKYFNDEGNFQTYITKSVLIFSFPPWFCHKTFVDRVSGTQRQSYSQDLERWRRKTKILSSFHIEDCFLSLLLSLLFYCYFNCVCRKGWERMFIRKDAV
jgi:hypothetical protein